MEKIIVMIFEEGKAPIDADWTSAVKLNADQHDEAYEMLCKLQDE
jgi:hypothetical protein